VQLFQVGSLGKFPTWEPIAGPQATSLNRRFHPPNVFDSESFELAMRMRKIRLRQGLKQAEVARRMGLDPCMTSHDHPHRCFAVTIVAGLSVPDL
jgi:hypothetical protein